MAKTPEEMKATMVANLAEKTGHDLQWWLRTAKASGLDKHGAVVAHLKGEHGLTHGYANLVAHDLLQSDASATPADDLVAAQYSGPKAGLRPIHDRLMAAIAQFGPDVEIAPKKAYVSLRRNKQFALIQPSTKDRVDVGIQLVGTAPTGRLEASGSFNAMVSHRVRVTGVDEVDPELIAWLRAAYDAC
jgi:hypothetical protein